MNTSEKISSFKLVLIILFYITSSMLAIEVEAKSKVVAMEGINYNVDSSIVDNLNSLVGKKVYVILDSGKSLAGIIKVVGNHLLHLEQLDAKDYFDALIRIENISAIETRFRKIQR